MAEIKIGDLVGLDMSSNRARRIRVVVEINGNNAVVADGYGTHVAKITDLNISIPGFLVSPLSPAMEKVYGIDKDK